MASYVHSWLVIWGNRLVSDQSNLDYRNNVDINDVRLSFSAIQMLIFSFTTP